MTEDGTAQLEYYTKARNYLFDEIIPAVTRDCPQGRTAGLILFIIERKAAGFHEVAANVSIPDMESFTNGSRSDVKRARSWLIAEGYVEVLYEGNGLETSILRIVLDPEQREAVKSAQKDRTKPVNKPAKIISRPTESARQIAPTERQLPKDLHFPSEPNESARTDEKSATSAPHGDEVPQTGDSDPVEPHATPPNNETPETDSRICQYESALKANEIKRVLPGPPSRASIVSYTPGNKEETNKESKAENEEKKSAFGAVCSLASSQKAKMEYRDYAFARWAVESYGAKAVESKIQIAKFQIKRGVKFTNPLGWLRDALTRDYQPAKFDSQVMNGREKAQRGRDRAERERAEAANERRKWQADREQNPNAAKEAYAAFLRLTAE